MNDNNEIDNQEFENIKHNKECDWEELKVQLNNVVLCYGPSNVTLAQAEESMLRLISYLNQCYVENQKIQS